MVLPSMKTSRVAGIDTFEGELAAAFAPMSVALRLEDEIDVSRGDMLVHPEHAPEVKKRFTAMLVWMSERPLDLGKSYFLKHATQLVRAEVESVQHAVDMEQLSPVKAKHLELNDIGKVVVSCHKPLFFDPYSVCRATGAFVLIDPISNNTVAAGMIQSESAAERADAGAAQLSPHSLVSRGERRERLEQTGAVVWLTGLPGAGKTELAYAMERRLFDAGRLAVVIDPDDGVAAVGGPRGGSPPHAPELARRFADAGLVAIFAFASPLASDRTAVKECVGAERFFEVHIATPIELCRERDQRGSYDALHGPLEYEPPDAFAARVSLAEGEVDSLARDLVDVLVPRITR
jgi:bifunctional enzyme CysN/CysC